VADELISHIGIAVRDLQTGIATWERATGRKVALVTEVADQKVIVAMFGADDHSGARIELVAPTSSDSPIARFIEKRGEGLHHICIYVDDIEGRLRELQEAGVALIDKVPRIGAEGDKIAFVHPSGLNGVLLELHQKST
jgi:methylmalonyl-CoA/ethylmalonyl-CoA epimerase